MDKERGRLSTQYRCAQRPAASEQRPRSSARPVLSTGVDRSSVRANRSELHPSRGPASPPTVIAKKKSTKRNQQKGLRRPVRQVPRFSRARENRRELVNRGPVPLCATAGGHRTTTP